MQLRELSGWWVCQQIPFPGVVPSYRFHFEETYRCDLYKELAPSNSPCKGPLYQLVASIIASLVHAFPFEPS